MKEIKQTKQWQSQEKASLQDDKEKRKAYIMTYKEEKRERNDKGHLIISYEIKKKAPFERVNETAKILKITKMQELLDKINEIEQGV